MPPSPAIIPQSTSDPYLSCTSSQAVRHLPPSNRSAYSIQSSKSIYWQAWSNLNKLGSLVLPGRKSIDSSSRHADLTEESLEAHNRRQEDINILHEKNAKCSPYYKGLVDYSLIINRERQPLPIPPTSPGRESHVTAITSSSLSTFMFKMQDWSSCLSFSSKSNNVKSNEDNAPSAVLATSINKIKRMKPSPADPSHPASSSSEPSARTILASVDKIKPMKPSPEAPSHSAFSFFSEPSARTTFEKETPNVNALPVVTEEKPLRERVSESKSPAAAPSLTNDDHHDILDCASTLDVMDTGRKFTWADKYQPKALKDFICNRDQAIRMQGLIKDVDCNHFIFEGPAGVGKRTMIRAMFQEVFGSERVQTREECKSFNLKGEQIDSIEVRVKVSSQHVEVNLSDLKGYEKDIIVELIKETHHHYNNNYRIISNHPVNPKSKLDDCRAIILYEADKLSTDALLYIKWVLERYKGFSKFFFCCNDVSKLQPVRSLCTVVQLIPPSKKEVVEVLEFIAKQEGIELPYPLPEKIADNSKNNLRQAIRSFEATWHRSYPFTEDQEILTGWEDDIANIAKDMVEDQSPKQLYIIRGKLQSLIEHDVSPDFFFKCLLEELKKHLDEPLQLQLDGLRKDYNRNDGNMLEISEDELIFLRSRHEDAGKRLHDPARKTADHLFVRIEEFIAKFMSFYKISVTNNKSIQHDGGP